MCDGAALVHAHVACKPGSVSACAPDGHSSRSAIARTLQQPTRSVSIGVGAPRCLFGLAPAGVYPATTVASRAVGSYPTISPLPAATRVARWRCVFCGTVRRRRSMVWPAAPRRYLATCPMEPGLSSANRASTVRRDRPATCALSKNTHVELTRRVQSFAPARVRSTQRAEPACNIVGSRPPGRPGGPLGRAPSRAASVVPDGLLTDPGYADPRIAAAGDDPCPSSERFDAARFPPGRRTRSGTLPPKRPRIARRCRHRTHAPGANARRRGGRGIVLRRPSRFGG